MIRYDASIARYHTARYDAATIWHRTVLSDTMQSETIRYDTIRYTCFTLQYSTTRCCYDMAPYCTVRYDAVRNDTIRCTTDIVRYHTRSSFTPASCCIRRRFIARVVCAELLFSPLGFCAPITRHPLRDIHGATRGAR